MPDLEYKLKLDTSSLEQALQMFAQRTQAMGALSPAATMINPATADPSAAAYGMAGLGQTPIPSEQVIRNYLAGIGVTNALPLSTSARMFLSTMPSVTEFMGETIGSSIGAGIGGMAAGTLGAMAGGLLLGAPLGAALGMVGERATQGFIGQYAGMQVVRADALAGYTPRMSREDQYEMARTIRRTADYYDLPLDSALTAYHAAAKNTDLFKGSSPEEMREQYMKLVREFKSVGLIMYDTLEETGKVIEELNQRKLLMKDPESMARLASSLRLTSESSGIPLPQLMDYIQQMGQRGLQGTWGSTGQAVLGIAEGMGPYMNAYQTLPDWAQRVVDNAGGPGALAGAVQMSLQSMIADPSKAALFMGWQAGGMTPGGMPGGLDRYMSAFGNATPGQQQRMTMEAATQLAYASPVQQLEYLKALSNMAFGNSDMLLYDRDRVAEYLVQQGMPRAQAYAIGQMAEQTGTPAFDQEELSGLIERRALEVRAGDYTQEEYDSWWRKGVRALSPGRQIEDMGAAMAPWMMDDPVAALYAFGQPGMTGRAPFSRGKLSAARQRLFGDRAYDRIRAGTLDADDWARRMGRTPESAMAMGDLLYRHETAETGLAAMRTLQSALNAYGEDIIGGASQAGRQEAYDALMRNLRDNGVDDATLAQVTASYGAAVSGETPWARQQMVADFTNSVRTRMDEFHTAGQLSDPNRVANVRRVMRNGFERIAAAKGDPELVSRVVQETAANLAQAGATPEEIRTFQAEAGAGDPTKRAGELTEELRSLHLMRSERMDGRTSGTMLTDEAAALERIRKARESGQPLGDADSRWLRERGIDPKDPMLEERLKVLRSGLDIRQEVHDRRMDARDVTPGEQAQVQINAIMQRLMDSTSVRDFTEAQTSIAALGKRLNVDVSPALEALRTASTEVTPGGAGTNWVHAGMDVPREPLNRNLTLRRYLEAHDLSGTAVTGGSSSENAAIGRILERNAGGLASRYHDTLTKVLQELDEAGVSKLRQDEVRQELDAAWKNAVNTAGGGKGTADLRATMDVIARKYQPAGKDDETSLTAAILTQLAGEPENRTTGANVLGMHGYEATRYSPTAERGGLALFGEYARRMESISLDNVDVIQRLRGVKGLDSETKRMLESGTPEDMDAARVRLQRLMMSGDAKTAQEVGVALGLDATLTARAREAYGDVRKRLEESGVKVTDSSVSDALMVAVSQTRLYDIGTRLSRAEEVIASVNVNGRRIDVEAGAIRDDKNKLDAGKAYALARSEAQKAGYKGAELEARTKEYLTEILADVDATSLRKIREANPEKYRDLTDEQLRALAYKGEVAPERLDRKGPPGTLDGLKGGLDMKSLEQTLKSHEEAVRKVASALDRESLALNNATSANTR